MRSEDHSTLLENQLKESTFTSQRRISLIVCKFIIAITTIIVITITTVIINIFISHLLWMRVTFRVDPLDWRELYSRRILNSFTLLLQHLSGYHSAD